MEYKDYYKIMGVTRKAKPDEIKRSYRKLARKYHPDVSKEANAEAKFKELQEAYAVLKDPEKRAAYDQLGSNWKSQQEFRPPPEWGQQFGGFQFHSDFGGGGGAASGFSDFFDSLFGGGFTRGRAGGARREFKARGQDVHSKIAISLEDAFNGTTQTIRLQIPEINQQGMQHFTTKTLKVKIPQGIATGQQIRLTGQGGEGVGGGPNGDLYLEITFRPHHLFNVEGKDVYLTLPLTPWEAALGAKITIPTLAAKVEMKVPVGTQSGTKMRLKGKGFPGGDQYVTFQIKVPVPQNEQERQLYATMARDMNFNPRQGML
jgi:curved DNA-binding protein